jgi:hypothetical protein
MARVEVHSEPRIGVGDDDRCVGAGREPGRAQLTGVVAVRRVADDDGRADDERGGEHGRDREQLRGASPAVRVSGDRRRRRGAGDCPHHHVLEIGRGFDPRRRMREQIVEQFEVVHAGASRR